LSDNTRGGKRWRPQAVGGLPGGLTSPHDACNLIGYQCTLTGKPLKSLGLPYDGQGQANTGLAIRRQTCPWLRARWTALHGFD